MINYNKGFSPILVLIILTLILGVGAAWYFGLGKYVGINWPDSSTPAKLTAAPTPAPTETAKQKLYEANKEQIKADLEMSEEEFQILKRFSED